MRPSDIDQSLREFSCKLCSADGHTFEDFTTHLKSKNHLERVRHHPCYVTISLLRLSTSFPFSHFLVMFSFQKFEPPLSLCQAGVVQAEEASIQEEDGEAGF